MPSYVSQCHQSTISSKMVLKKWWRSSCDLIIREYVSWSQGVQHRLCTTRLLVNKFNFGRHYIWSLSGALLSFYSLSWWCHTSIKIIYMDWGLDYSSHMVSHVSYLCFMLGCFLRSSIFISLIRHIGCLEVLCISLVDASLQLAFQKRIAYILLILLETAITLCIYSSFLLQYVIIMQLYSAFIRDNYFLVPLKIEKIK